MSKSICLTRYVVEMLTSLRQDGNGDWVRDFFVFPTKEDAERFAQQKSNGWVHCYVRRIGESDERK